MRKYFRYRDTIIDDIIKLYMPSVEFRESFNKELLKYLSDKYKGQIRVEICGNHIDNINYNLNFIGTDLRIYTILNINPKSIYNYISDDLDLPLFCKILLRNQKIETLLN